jgi:hypothetical protein
MTVYRHHARPKMNRRAISTKPVEADLSRFCLNSGFGNLKIYLL